MTRIVGNDNLDRGLSSYAVEMTELRSILKRSNQHTLVLGDELCHGTESASAVSLVAASLMHLANVNCSFIFATHLHELSQMPEIVEIGKINQYHLSIHYDNKHDSIIYDRIMKPGSGQGLYGIEVAKFLQLPLHIVESAYKIRNKYYTSTPVKKSNYNSSMLISKCKIQECNKNADHTHHIRYQCEADSNGYVTESMHKDNKDNLVGLCETHHNHVHLGTNNQQLIIFGYSGTRLQYEYRKHLNSLT